MRGQLKNRAWQVTYMTMPFNGRKKRKYFYLKNCLRYRNIFDEQNCTLILFKSVMFYLFQIWLMKRLYFYIVSIKKLQYE